MKYHGPPQSGSLGNQVASRNQWGQYLRTRVTPTDPATAPQVAARLRMKSAVAAWQALSDPQRLAWNALANYSSSRPGFPAESALNGFVLFVRAYAVGSLYTGTLPTDPPSAWTPLFTLQGCTLTLGPGTMSADFVAAPGALIAIFATPPGRASWAYSTFPRPRFLRVFGGLPPVSISAEYAAVFGSLPSSGQAVFLRCREVTTIDVSWGVLSRGVQP